MAEASTKTNKHAIGWVGLCGKPAQQDCLLVECLRKQGAVLYCKTNIPQSLMVS